MNEFKPKEKYTPQKLSKLADFRIRLRLFRMFVVKVFGNFSISPKLVAGTLVFALLVVYIAPSQINEYRINNFVERAEAAHNEFEEKKKNSIYHHKYLVSEGKGKAAFVSKQTGISISDTSQVELRHDLVEEWSHGITNFSQIETDVAGRPLKVYLNLENEDHMHVFEYTPNDCTELLVDGIETSSCTNTEKADETYVAHRTTFDSVHDIESLYSDKIKYHEEPIEEVSVKGLEYVDRKKENGEYFYVFSSRKDSIEEHYYFSAETYLFKKKIVYIVDGAERYEMSTIVEIEQTFVEAEKWDEVFNPKKYSFEQVEVFPI
jgi:hypothetical protein